MSGAKSNKNRTVISAKEVLFSNPSFILFIYIFIVILYYKIFKVCRYMYKLSVLKSNSTAISTMGPYNAKKIVTQVNDVETLSRILTNSCVCKFQKNINNKNVTLSINSHFNIKYY